MLVEFPQLGHSPQAVLAKELRLQNIRVNSINPGAIGAESRVESSKSMRSAMHFKYFEGSLEVMAIRD